MWKLGCLGAVAVIVAIPIVAGLYLPWWGTVLVIIAEIVALRLAVPRLLALALRRFGMRLLDTKSRVLRDASVRILRVEPYDGPSFRRTRELQSPEDEDEEVFEAEATPPPTFAGRHVMVEFTLTPRPGGGPMSHWDPSDLRIVAFDTRIGRNIDDDHDDDHAATLEDITLIDEAGREIDDIDKRSGAARRRCAGG
jgi:hypothetical protein